jgi:hypothetical protein
MVKKVHIYRNNELMLIPIEDYLEQYEYRLSGSWYEYQKYIDDAFNIKTNTDCKAFKKAFGVSKFDCSKMQIFYEKIKNELSFFDDDILRYIAFLEGLHYFEMIGNPSLDIWLNNTRDLNRPFEENNDYMGFSILDVVNLKYGGNAIRNKLLWATRVIHGSFA